MTNNDDNNVDKDDHVDDNVDDIGLEYAKHLVKR